jgi:hypothetical protein
VSSRYFVISAALALAAALSVLPVQAVSAASTSVTVLLPNSGGGNEGGAFLSGSQWFDAVPNGSGDTSVQFVLSGVLGTESCSATFGGTCVVGEATPTLIGWLVHFNTEDVPNGRYDLIATASPSGASGRVSVQVSNMPPTVVLPSAGSTVSGNQWLDCVPPPGMSQVEFEVSDGVTSQTLTPAFLTLFGWLYDWNTSGVPNGTYDLYCLALTPVGGWASGASISITVAN